MQMKWLSGILLSGCIGAYCTNDAGRYDWRASADRQQREDDASSRRNLETMNRRLEENRREFNRSLDRMDEERRHNEAMEELRRPRSRVIEID